MTILIFDKLVWLKEIKFPELALNLKRIFKTMESIVPPIKINGDMRLNFEAVAGECCNESSNVNECDKPKLYLRTDPITK